jgi:hypothetical protein
MMEHSYDPAADADAVVSEHAAAVAAQMTGEAATFAQAAATMGAEYEALLRAVAERGAAFAFDRDGRPSAIDAVRQALPAVERDLFDAILDDYACERAAVEEALYRVALAYGRRCREAR